MALTKVSALVSEISKLLWGTTKVEISSTGGPIDVDVAGVNVLDMTTTTLTVDDLVTATIKKLVGEDFDLSTVSGAAGTVVTNATDMKVGSTSSHPLEILQNNIARVTFGTDGKATLGVVGTAAAHLIDKNYVDINTPGSNAVTLATNGQIILDNPSGNNLIVKWGVLGGSGDRVYTFSTDTAAFPNAIYAVVATPQDTGAANSDGLQGTESISVTAFTWNVANKGGFAGAIGWIAIGS